MGTSTEPGFFMAELHPGLQQGRGACEPVYVTASQAKPTWCRKGSNRSLALDTAITQAVRV